MVNKSFFPGTSEEKTCSQRTREKAKKKKNIYIYIYMCIHMSLLKPPKWAKTQWTLGFLGKFHKTISATSNWDRNEWHEDVPCSWFPLPENQAVISSLTLWTEKRSHQLLLECSNVIPKWFWDTSRERQTWLISCVLVLAGWSGEKGLGSKGQIAKDKLAMTSWT